MNTRSISLALVILVFGDAVWGQPQEPNVAAIAASELTKLEESLVEQIQDLDRSSALRTVRTMRIISSICDRSTWHTTLINSLHDEDPRVRALGCDLLAVRANLTASELDQLLDRLETDPDPSVRASAATCLSILAPANLGAIKILMNAAQFDRSVYVRSRAIIAVTRVAPFSEALATFYRNWLMDDEPLVRVAALLALSQVGEQAAPLFNDVAKRLQDKHVEVRKSALTALGNIHTEGNSPPDDLFLALVDDNHEIANLSEHALESFGNAALEGLIKQISLNNDKNRISSVRILGKLFDSEKAKTALMSLLDDKNPELRCESALALASMGVFESKIVDIMIDSQANELRKATCNTEHGFVPNEDESILTRLRLAVDASSGQATLHLIAAAGDDDRFRQRAAIQLLRNEENGEALPIMKEVLQTIDGEIVRDILSHCERQGFRGTMVAYDGLYTSSYYTRRCAGGHIAYHGNPQIARSRFRELLEIEKFGSVETAYFNSATKSLWSSTKQLRKPWPPFEELPSTDSQQVNLQAVPDIDDFIGALSEVLREEEVGTGLSPSSLVAIAEQAKRTDEVIASLRTLAHNRVVPRGLCKLLVELFDTKLHWDHNRELHFAAIDALLSLDSDCCDELLPLLSSPSLFQRQGALAVLLKQAPHNLTTLQATDAFLLDAYTTFATKDVNHGTSDQVYRDLLCLVQNLKSREDKLGNLAREAAPKLAFAIIRKQNPASDLQDLLTNCLKDSNSTVVTKAIKLVGQLELWNSETRACIASQLSSTDALTRAIALEVLAISQPNNNWQLGLAYLNDTSPVVRDVAIVCVAVQPTLATVSTLCEKFTNSQNEDVRVTIIRALGMLGPISAGAKNQLLKCTKSDSVAVRTAAVRALRHLELPDDDVMEAFRVSCQDRDSLVRCEALIGLAKYGNQGDIRGILPGLNSDNEAERAWTAFAIGFLVDQPCDEIVAALTAALIDKSAAVRFHALWALRQVGEHSERIARCFDRALTDENEMCAFQALLGVGELGAHGRSSIARMINVPSLHDCVFLDDAMLISLGKLGRSIDPFMSHVSQSISQDPCLFEEEVAQYLKLFQVVSPKEDSIPALLRFASEKHSVTAVEILAEIGPTAHEALQKLAKSPSEAVKASALRSLDGQIIATVVDQE